MIYRETLGEKISLLGFGAMRLPLLPGGGETDIDLPQLREMIRLAFEGGVNYFDTAYPYHGGMSEIVLGGILRDYPRDSFLLADKFPGHQISQSYDPEAVFEHQLKKCGVEYFDFYLLHNVYENSVKTYDDPRWGIIDYFKKQKSLGRIHHLGFSSHGGLDLLSDFLDRHGEDMEFCQIQLNYLDYGLQNAKAKYELLQKHSLPVWVMEPVRGGRLARLPEGISAPLRALDPSASDASWAFRWLQDLEGVGVILSGMSDIGQVRDNLKTFENHVPLPDETRAYLESAGRKMADSIPCTACRYCCAGCPAELDIPMLIEAYNDVRYNAAVNTSMRIDALPPGKRPDACLQCGACAAVCPQKIDIPRHLHDFAAKLKTMPSWAEISRKREEAAKKLAASEE